MKVCVTLEEVMTGKQGSTIHCPVALAIKKLGLSNVSVNRHFIIPDRFAKGCASWIKTPEAVVNFIAIFDKNGLADPIEFEVELNV